MMQKMTKTNSRLTVAPTSYHLKTRMICISSLLAVSDMNRLINKLIFVSLAALRNKFEFTKSKIFLTKNIKFMGRLHNLHKN